MGITTKRSGTPVKFDAAKAAKVISAFVPGAILLRTAQGKSTTGAAFADYSDSYRKTLQAMGEDQKVDLRLTGGLLNSVKVRDTVTAADYVQVTIAPDNGTSAQVVPKKKKMKKTGKRGPPHNVLGYWLHHGTATTPARPFMGLTKEQEAELYRLLGKARIFG